MLVVGPLFQIAALNFPFRFSLYPSVSVGIGRIIPGWHFETIVKIYKKVKYHSRMHLRMFSSGLIQKNSEHKLGFIHAAYGKVIS